MDMHSPYGTDWRNEDDNYLQIQDDRETVGNEGGTLFKIDNDSDTRIVLTLERIGVNPTDLPIIPLPKLEVEGETGLRDPLTLNRSLEF